MHRSAPGEASEVRCGCTRLRRTIPACPPMGRLAATLPVSARYDLPSASGRPPATAEPYPSVHPATEVYRGLEDGHTAGRNLDGFSGPGVAARAGLAVSDLEGAESPELDAIASRERFLHGGEKGVDHHPAFLLGDAWSDRIGDLINEVGFGHPGGRLRMPA